MDMLGPNTPTATSAVVGYTTDIGWTITRSGCALNMTSLVNLHSRRDKSSFVISKSPNLPHLLQHLLGLHDLLVQHLLGSRDPAMPRKMKVQLPLRRNRGRRHLQLQSLMLTKVTMKTVNRPARSRALCPICRRTMLPKCLVTGPTLMKRMIT